MLPQLIFTQLIWSAIVRRVTRTERCRRSCVQVFGRHPQRIADRISFWEECLPVIVNPETQRIQFVQRVPLQHATNKANYSQFLPLCFYTERFIWQFLHLQMGDQTLACGKFHHSLQFHGYIELLSEASRMSNLWQQFHLKDQIDCRTSFKPDLVSHRKAKRVSMHEIDCGSGGR